MIMMQVLCISSVYLPSKFVLQLLTFHLHFQTGVIDMENDWKLYALSSLEEMTSVVSELYVPKEALIYM